MRLCCAGVGVAMPHIASDLAYQVIHSRSLMICTQQGRRSSLMKWTGGVWTWGPIALNLTFNAGISHIQG